MSFLLLFPVHLPQHFPVQNPPVPGRDQRENDHRQVPLDLGPRQDRDEDLLEDHQTPDRRPGQDRSPDITRNLLESEMWGRPLTTATAHLPPSIKERNQELHDEVPQLRLPGDIQSGKVNPDLQDETIGVHREDLRVEATGVHQEGLLDKTTEVHPEEIPFETLFVKTEVLQESLPWGITEVPQQGLPFRITEVPQESLPYEITEVHQEDLPANI